MQRLLFLNKHPVVYSEIRNGWFDPVQEKEKKEEKLSK